MAGIKDAMKDILAKLATIMVPDGDGGTMQPYVRVWNNQFIYTQEGKMETFQMPAFFLEVQNQTRYQIIGGGFRDADVTFKIHILHNFQNDGTGVGYEQDLEIFDLRDRLLAVMSLFKPAGCGLMTCVVEEQDYSHNNIYHYIMDFIVNFTDSKASRLDPDSDYYKDSPTDLGLEIDATLTTGQPELVQQPFIIPTR